MLPMRESRQIGPAVPAFSGGGRIGYLESSVAKRVLT
jgi:hypothetical protein